MKNNNQLDGHDQNLTAWERECQLVYEELVKEGFAYPMTADGRCRLTDKGMRMGSLFREEYDEFVRTGVWPAIDRN
jgi:hypothetical protein